MSDTLEGFITWIVIFIVIIVCTFIYNYIKVSNDLSEYKNMDRYKGLTDENIKFKEAFIEAKYAIILLGIAFFLFFCISVCTDSSFKTNNKIDNSYRGSDEQQQDIDFANELIQEEIENNK